MSMPNSRFFWSVLWRYVLFLLALNLLVIGAAKIFYDELGNTTETLLGLIDFFVCVPAAIESADFARTKKASQALRYSPNVKLMFAAVCFYTALLMGAAVICFLTLRNAPLAGAISIVISSFVAVPITAAVTRRWGRRSPDNGAVNAASQSRLDASRRDDSARRQEIIDDYARILEERSPGTDFVDASILPHSKAEILDAILLEVIHEPDGNMVELLTRGVECLPHFQPEIGNKPLRIMNVTLPEVSAANQGSVDDMVEVMHKFASSPEREQYLKVQEIVQAELVDIRLKLVVAMKLREQVLAKK